MESQIYCPVCHTGEVQKSRSANRWFYWPFRVVSVAARCRYCGAVFLVRRPLFGGHVVPPAFIDGPHKRRGVKPDSIQRDLDSSVAQRSVAQRSVAQRSVAQGSATQGSAAQGSAAQGSAEQERHDLR